MGALRVAREAPRPFCRAQEAGAGCALALDVFPGNGLTVVLNEHSGATRKESEAHKVADAFRAAGLSPDVVRARGAEIPRAAQRAAHTGHAVVAAGGDGTVSSVAAEAIRAGVPLGVLPLGTLNHFARDAGVPLDVEGAVAVIAAGSTRMVDVGEVNGRTFLNNTSVGIYPRLVWERQMEQRRGRRKWTAFAIALVRTWIRYRSVTVHLTVDGVEHVRRTPFVLIGNGAYEAEGPWLGRRPSLQTGVLSVYIAPEASRWEMLMLPLRAIMGRLTPATKLESFLATEVSVEMPRRRVSIAVDGELLIAEPPIRSRIRPRALRVLAPETP